MTPQPRPVKLLVADVDGTLVTSDKVLTERSVEAVRELSRRGIRFAVTSGRPPRGMAMLIEPLALTTPLAGFNGGVFVRPDMSILEERVLPAAIVDEVVSLLDDHGLDTWLYRGSEWFVRRRRAPHVDREASTVGFEPKVVDSYRPMAGGVAKLVGVSDDHGAVDRAAEAVRERFGDHVSAAASQPYYLDITHPKANKGEVLGYLARHLDVDPSEICAIGDMPNDVLMFAHAGLSIAMGNASKEVQRSARRVTASNDDEGFAKAVERYVLAT